jgi:N-terminal domain of cytochrome oxidase-cbb3, FixP
MTNQTQGEEAHTEGETYTYKDSGIRERHGRVPIWLQLVAYGLFIWGIYYTIKYW